jgi:hypothetical protein
MPDRRLPHFFRRAASFLRASAKETAAVARGEPPLPKEEAALRLATCVSNVCGQYDGGDLCLACGCRLREKVKWRTAKCPEGLW